MIALPHLAEIERHLETLSSLADAVEARRLSLHAQVRQWIKEAEELLRRHAIVQAGDLAVIRAELAIAVRGDSSEAARPRRFRGKRGRAEQAAAEALTRAARVLESTLAPWRQLSREGERLARQIASVAKAKGHASAHAADWGAVSEAWERASRDSDLVGVTTHLVGLVGRTNAMLLLARAQGDV